MYDIAVTGPGGFLGGAISRELTVRGHRVIPFTRSEPLASDGSLAPAADHARVVVWAAGGISPSVAHVHPELVAADLAHFRSFVDAVAAHPDPLRVVLLSSGGTVYGVPEAPPFPESSAPNPANAYGRYKLAQEVALAESGVLATAVRVSNAYGPGQRGSGAQGVLAIWMRAILQGEPIRIHGSGAVARDYVYVDDVARAVADVAETPTSPIALNVGSGRPTSLDGLLDVLSSVVGDRRVRVERLPSRAADAASTWLDVRLARETLGWVPTVGLGEGIERMWRWAEGS